MRLVPSAVDGVLKVRTRDRNHTCHRQRASPHKLLKAANISATFVMLRVTTADDPKCSGERPWRNAHSLCGLLIQIYQ